MPENANVTIELLDAVQDAFNRHDVDVIPDMRWEDMSHFISTDGSKACSEWTVRGTPKDGDAIDWLGCDVWTFREGLVTKKDTYWKHIDA